MRVAVVFLFSGAALCTGCNGKIDNSAGRAIQGQYTIDGTYVVTSRQDASGTPGGMYAPHRYQQVISVNASQLPQVQIDETGNGASFPAELMAGTITARDVSAIIDPNGSLSSYGIQNRKVRQLQWALARGDYKITDEHANVHWPPPGKFITFIDGRIVGASSPARSWLRYRADTNFPWEFPHGGSCVLGGSDTAEGYLGLAFGANRNEVNIYVQGVACTFTALSQDGNLFVASNTNCVFEQGMSIANIGIQSWTFEAFSLDVQARHVSFLARATRRAADGQLYDLCLKLESSLAGDILH